MKPYTAQFDVTPAAVYDPCGPREWLGVDSPDVEAARLLWLKLYPREAHRLRGVVIRPTQPLRSPRQVLRDYLLEP